MRPRKVKKDEEREYNELLQLFIDKYRIGHFDSIKSLEKVLRECRKLLKEAERAREKKRLENLIKSTDKELLKLRSWTPQVLKNANRMQRQLNSVKWGGIFQYSDTKKIEYEDLSVCEDAICVFIVLVVALLKIYQ